MKPNQEPFASAADGYLALLSRFEQASRAHNSGEIDFATFRQIATQIDEETRILNFRRKLERACRNHKKKQDSAPQLQPS